MAFSCYNCSSEFPTEARLRKHMNILGSEHSKCPDCIVVMRKRQDMLRHRRERHGPLPAMPSRNSFTSQPRGRAPPVWTPLQLHTPHQLEQSPSDGPTTTMASNSSNENIKWTVIPVSEYQEALTRLRALVHSTDVLRKHHYLRRSEEAPEDFKVAPQVLVSAPKRHAVALDCEMVGSCDGKGKEYSVLARLSVVDYMTGEVILDSLVQPDVRVTDWRTKYSGVTCTAMNAAVRRGQALRGIMGAQAELWKHVDQETVIVGQSLKNDFDALRIVHLRAVDCGIVVGEAVGIPSQSLFGLKITCTELLGIKIQQNGHRGHDSIEDSLAAREVVLFCLNEEEKVKAWAKGKREENAIAEAKRALQRMAALDEKISWSREIFEERSTKKQLKTATNRLPFYQRPADWSDRHRESLQKQYEMLIAPMEANWESTITQSREPWYEPPVLKSMYKARLPPSTRPIPEENTKQDSAPNLQVIRIASIGKQSRLSIITEDVTTLLDKPLDDSETSLLMDPMLPSSPSSASTI